jgi:hypothetical protein
MNPLFIWIITTLAGAWIFMLLVRRSQTDDDSWSASLVAATESEGPVPAGVPLAAPRPVDGPSASSAAQPARPPAAPRAPQVFSAAPAKGVERVKVGYRRVRLSSKPDAVRSVELGRLERGDEVEIIESYEGFLRVQTPGGVTGWIQRHTVVGEWEG